MLAFSFAVAISLTPGPTGTAPPGQPIQSAVPPETEVHLGISLRPTNVAERDALRRDLQDPSSPNYKRWLTPEEYGQRFGQPVQVYEQLAAWLAGAGLRISRSPNRTFLEASGKAASVEGLLHIQLLQVAGQPASVHVPSGEPNLPPSLAAAVLHVSGLDTRVPFYHRLQYASGKQTLGPQDLRALYGVQPLLDRGFVGQGQQLVVLSMAEPPGSGASTSDIEYFLRNISDARARFVTRTLSNPQNDFDTSFGGGTEFDLDVETQSVGAPGADTITLVVSPASEVFTTGPNDIVNNLPGATAVSISLGTCEPAEQQRTNNEAQTLRDLIIQGTMEGQTWSAATGDNGADDCRDGQTVAVDFPSTIPEMVAAGGTSIPGVAWDSNGALTAYEQEEAWNAGSGAGAAGGGISVIYGLPDYQAAFGFSGRSVPDLALISGVPGAAIDSALPGQIVPAQGTSVASPLSAGFFALIASRVGCRLGDVHATLYALGARQQDGGAAVFHDIVQGSLSYDGLPGPSAAVGYDSATGWGSLDVQALADAWPKCPLVDGGMIDAGVTGGPPYSQCGFIDCDAGAICTTLAEGPSSCVAGCDLQNAASCASGTVCSSDNLFSADGGAVCVTGCSQDGDCAAQPGTACSICQLTCVPAGNPAAHIGDPCTDSSQCPTGSDCHTSQIFTGGYCMEGCTPTTGLAACSCPTGSLCEPFGFGGTTCLTTCARPGVVCPSRSDYFCQPLADKTSACLPPCQILSFGGQSLDSCQVYGSTEACDVASGICGGPIFYDAGPDGGPDAGAPDAGDAGTDAGADAGEVRPDGGSTLSGHRTGCGCTPGADGPDLSSALFGAALLVQRLRRTRR